MAADKVRSNAAASSDTVCCSSAILASVAASVHCSVGPIAPLAYSCVTASSTSTSSANCPTSKPYSPAMVAAGGAQPMASAISASSTAVRVPIPTIAAAAASRHHHVVSTVRSRSHSAAAARANTVAVPGSAVGTATAAALIAPPAQGNIETPAVW